MSSSKLTELFKLKTHQLESQLARIIETRIVLLSLLSRLSKQPENLAQTIRELDSALFTEGRNWHMIILAMNYQNSMFDSTRTTLMSKYVMYLHSIEEAISNICGERSRLGEDEIEEDIDFTQIASTKSTESINSLPLEQGFKPIPF